MTSLLACLVWSDLILICDTGQRKDEELSLIEIQFLPTTPLKGYYGVHIPVEEREIFFLFLEMNGKGKKSLVAVQRLFEGGGIKRNLRRGRAELTLVGTWGSDCSFSQDGCFLGGHVRVRYVRTYSCAQKT